MSTTPRPTSVPPLRVRYGDSEADIVDIAWSADRDETDPPSIAILNTGVIHPAAKSSWDLEDPTDPDNDTYPPDEAAELPAVALVRCAASHWQRVQPHMRRFTRAELEMVDFFAGLGGVRAGLDELVRQRRHDCSYVLERHPAF